MQQELLRKINQLNYELINWNNS